MAAPPRAPIPRPTPPPVSREEIHAMGPDALLERVALLRSMDPLTEELADRLRAALAELAQLRRGGFRARD